MGGSWGDHDKNESNDEDNRPDDRDYFPISGMPRPLLILRARLLLISVCRGTASVAPVEGLVHNE